ncbi:MAG: hypothetical protein QXH10_09380 [Ignisphaera sp.]
MKRTKEDGAEVCMIALKTKQGGCRILVYPVKLYSVKTSLHPLLNSRSSNVKSVM